VSSIRLKAFNEYGLPWAIRSDYGRSDLPRQAAYRGCSQFVRMGITPERITPENPQENGLEERMHQTLKREAATPPSLKAKAQLVRRRRIFNEERPPEAPRQIPPAKDLPSTPAGTGQQAALAITLANSKVRIVGSADRSAAADGSRSFRRC